MAQEEPQLKKFKHSVISDHVYSANFEELFNKHWHNSTDIKEQNLEIISKPFRICKISNFLSKEIFMDEMKNELLDVKSRRNSIDLYQFEQTSDLANIDTKNLKLLYETFQSDLATWMEKNTKIKLNQKISMSSSCYSDTDYLLCHDDNMEDRRIAYILYLSKRWTVEDGGTLDLFDTDNNGLPRNIMRSLVPEYNSLVFFEVVDNSYHQVAEVTSPDKSRWSINGWFHGPLRDSNKPSRPSIIVKYIEPSNTGIDLTPWIAKCYLFPNIIKEIQRDVEQESFAFLSNFLREEVYNKLLEDLTSEIICWNKVGPADLRNYEVADEQSLPALLKDFYGIFKSISLFRLLKEYTELDLVPEREDMHPKMTIELQRWSKGCYTLICDKSTASETAFTVPEKKVSVPNNTCETETNIVETSKPSGTGVSVSYEETDLNCDKMSTFKSECNSSVPNRKEEDMEEEEILKRAPKGKSPRSKKKASNHQMENTSPQKSIITIDTDDSDVSDIGDYLSDPLDCSLECSDQEEDIEDVNASEPGALDVIIQFHTDRVPEEDTIDYVDPKEQEGALIHIPAKDNHLCLVYKTLSTCRVHKYVNHYCKNYFYNLICTYYE